MEGKQLTPAQQLESRLCSDSMIRKLSAVAPQGFNMDGFITTAVKYCSSNHKIIEADRNSLYYAVFDAAKAGVLLDGKEAFINVYKGKCVMQLMVKGGANTSDWKRYGAFVVREGDSYQGFMGHDGAEFKYSMSRKERGHLELVVAWCTDKEDFTRIVEVHFSRAEKIRDKEKAKAEAVAKKYGKKASGPWFDSEDEMYKKHAIGVMRKHVIEKRDDLDEIYSTEYDKDEEVNENTGEINITPEKPAMTEAQAAVYKALSKGE